MTSRDPISKQEIQEVEEGEKNFGIWNSIKSAQKKFINNELVSEFDLFSIPVKLNLNGQ
jgi:hypothetical protein